MRTGSKAWKRCNTIIGKHRRKLPFEYICLRLRVTVKKVPILMWSDACLVTSHCFDASYQALTSSRFTTDDISDVLVVSLATGCLRFLLETPKSPPVTVTVGYPCFLPSTSLPPTDMFGSSVVPRLVKSGGGILGWNLVLKSLLEML